jgi:hypothetical protein
MSDFGELSVTPFGIPVQRLGGLRDGEAIVIRDKGPGDPFHLMAPALWVAPHDRLGHFTKLPGEVLPFFTTCDVGMQEMARDRRRRRRRRGA